MTLAELHERIGWQLEGRLQIRHYCGKSQPDWHDWPCGNISCPELYENKDTYRRRPDAPPMPDEVWVSKRVVEEGNAVAYASNSEALCANRGANPVRYVRAGAVITASRLQCRSRTGEWIDCHDSLEYRIKP